MPSKINTETPKQIPGNGSSPTLAAVRTPLTAGTDSSSISTAERFRQELDRIAESFAVRTAGNIPLPESLRAEDQPPGLCDSASPGVEVSRCEASIQTDVQVGAGTWIVSLGAMPMSSSATAGDEQEVAKFEVISNADAEDEFDDCMTVDCVECDEESYDSDFKHPEEYESRVEKLILYGYEEPLPVEPSIFPFDPNFRKAFRRLNAKARRKLRKRAKVFNEGHRSLIMI